MSSSTSSFPPQQPCVQEFKSGASMWFANLDTSSSWGLSFPLSDPVASKKPIAKPKSFAPQNMSNDFVQVSSNQRWGSQNLKNETNKKAPKIPPCSQEEVSNGSGCEVLNDEETAQNLYKTELCRSFEETSICRYGQKCQFAHGRAELRPVSRHPKYKTEVCKTFHTIGTCPYGKRCRFIHTEAPTKNVPQTSAKENEPKTPSMPKNVDLISNATSNTSRWNSNWTCSPTSTIVNFETPVEIAQPSSPVAQVFSISAFPSLMETNERRSRLGFFQQFCS